MEHKILLLKLLFFSHCFRSFHENVTAHWHCCWVTLLQHCWGANSILSRTSVWIWISIHIKTKLKYLIKNPLTLKLQQASIRIQPKLPSTELISVQISTQTMVQVSSQTCDLLLALALMGFYPLYPVIIGGDNKALFHVSFIITSLFSDRLFENK